APGVGARPRPVEKLAMVLAGRQIRCNHRHLRLGPMPPEVTVSLATGWQYQPLERLGRGGSSSVWLARDASGERVALKIGHSGAERVRFAGEATRLTLAVSPALPSLFEVGLVPAAACHSL